MLASDAVTYLSNRLRIDEEHRLHPELSRQPIEAPLVILGLPRTGTTVASYLLDRDPQWRSLLNWEAVDSVPPPTTDTLRTDQRCLDKLAFQESVLPIIDPPPPHWEWADGPTECTFLLAGDFRSAMWDTRVPNPAYAEFIDNCDMSSAYAYHRRALQLLQSRAPGRWVLKMPAHAYFINGLLGEYPDAKVIWAHRDPLKAVASFLDLVGFAHGLALCEADVDWIRSVYPNRLADYISRIEAALERTGMTDDVFHLHYAALIDEPVATMHELYAWAGATLTEETQQSMRKWLDDAPIRRPRKRPYTLADWKLTASDLDPRFSEYAARYQVATEGTPT